MAEVKSQLEAAELERAILEGEPMELEQAIALALEVQAE